MICVTERDFLSCVSIIYNNKGDNVNTIQQKVSDANLYIVDHEMILNLMSKCSLYAVKVTAVQYFLFCPTPLTPANPLT